MITNVQINQTTIDESLTWITVPISNANRISGKAIVSDSTGGITSWNFTAILTDYEGSMTLLHSSVTEEFSNITSHLQVAVNDNTFQMGITGVAGTTYNWLIMFDQIEL